jgi:arylsulfatase A
MGSESRPNVLLVVLDSVRAMNCSLHSAPRATTPFLNRFATGARTYTQARAPSNWSLPSHVSLLTGLETHEHGVTVHDALRPGNTVFDDLAAAGYATGVFSENGFLTGDAFGLSAAFQTVVDVPDAPPDRYDTAAINHGPDGFYYADGFTEWRRDSDGPWAACLNLMDAHRPYEPREAFDLWGDDRARALQSELDVRWEWTLHSGERPYWQLAGLESLYDGGIRQTDAILERVVERLRADGVLDETLVVICGDHGEGFGEPGRLAGEPPAVAHIVPMHEELLHVPLLVRPPGGVDGERIHDPAALTRFPAVARGWADGRPPEQGFRAETVVATKQPVTGDLRDRFARHCDPIDPYTAPSRCVYTNAEGPAVRKRYYWGEEGADALIRRAGHIEATSSTDRAAADAAFTDSAATVRKPREDQAVTDRIKDQLAALGYY